MAASSGTGKKSVSGRKTTGRTAPGQKNNRVRTQQERMISNEISLIILFALAVLLFLCNFGIIGPVGNAVSGFMFGLFGLLAYITPIFVFLTAAFGISNRDNSTAMVKMYAAIVLFFLVAASLHLFQGDLKSMSGYSAGELYRLGSENKLGGGVLGGTIAYILYSLVDTIGAVLILAVLVIACVIIITEKSLLKGVKKGGEYVVSSARDDARYRQERAMERRKQQEEARQKQAKQREEARRQAAEREDEKEAEKILRMDKKVSGVMLDTSLKKETQAEKVFGQDNLHEITLNDLEQDPSQVNEDYHQTVIHSKPVEQQEFDFSRIRVHREEQSEDKEREDLSPEMQSDMHEIYVKTSNNYQNDEELHNPMQNTIPDVIPDGIPSGIQNPEVQDVPRAERVRPVAKPAQYSEKDRIMMAAGQDPAQVKQQEKKTLPYQFPPLSCLKPPKNKGNQDQSRQLKETALRLQQTLATFGVKVTITDISQGPTVTRYELQPEQGVKVSKIVGLSDDIKLNLAATDIRIEAPIPGKAAIGIEVPNKENSAVSLRELLESGEYKNFSSRLAFAVGKDIAGKVVVADIAKMPHMLIAGSTGSGKSVCINTLIMSILYKARPDEVKLIMVDPKVVELSVYNGIPHLLIPVVTDPKKAAAALHWGVAEMTDRYQRFADFNVRDLAGYNEEIERRKARGDSDVPEKMPQIVIIVDELADLMMVAPGEVEESICRLAQLARAAGIHLIIATQRPSVDVITGLIKANMPSRVAFAVSSGVDSRTILDMNGAEKLLGKGDMLFYPQGYPKPARIQGAFVSDAEVGAVVDFLKNQSLGNVYDTDIEDKIKSMGTSSGGGSQSQGGSQIDDYFVEAGKFIIDKDKASIGMLQRVFKIGFNRAARIMDQLAEAGVVGEEEGTKPRKVLMSMEQFEAYIEEYL